MSPLLDEHRVVLIRLARRAVTSAVLEGRSCILGQVPPALLQRSGAFVTLHRLGRLRGCIGQVEPIDPLAEAVIRCAAAAALEDPRFDPVAPHELNELQIELSILSRLQIISPERIEIGTHGLMVSRGGLRGLLLPQVATERRWTPERFLQETCSKAGLEHNAWKDPATRLEAFTAEIFSERDLPGWHLKQAS